MRPLSGIRLVAALFVLTAFALPVHGQGPVFGVYYNAGTIKYVPVHNGPTRPLAFHNWLSEGDRVVLEDNIAELILFDRDNNYLRIDGKGNYTVAELEKMPRKHVTDSMTVRYFSLLWNEAPHSPLHAPAERYKSADRLMIGPGYGYTTSLDTMIFRWHAVSWAQKYFLRIRNIAGDLLYDNVLVDTQATVNFAGRMPAGNTYYWALDLIGESGRLQFGDSSHIVLIDEASVLPRLPPLPMDSLGGIAAIFRRIRQFQAYGCMRHAADLFQQLSTDFPSDGALDTMYQDFLQRNGMR